MKIAIDVSQILFGTGVSHYRENLVKHLLKIDKENEYVLYGGSLRRFTELKSRTKEYSGKVIEKIFPFPPTAANIIWNKLHIFPIEWLTGKIDVLHSSDWTQPPGKAFKVTTVHDLFPLKFSRFTDPQVVSVHKARLNWVGKEVDRIIVPSEATKKDLLEVGFNETVIRVIPEAPNSSLVSKSLVEKTKRKHKIFGKYLLSVGVNPRKNTERIIEAFHLAKSGENIKLILVGHPNFIKVEEQRDVRILGHLEPDEISALYTGAEALVYPSLYEGFGVPILDAFKCRCPVVTSNLSSMPEVAGDAAILVDPYSTESIVEGIKKALATRKTLIKKDLLKLKSSLGKKPPKKPSKSTKKLSRLASGIIKTIIMIIGIDGNEANIEGRVGVNMYAFDLLWSIWQLQKKGLKKDRLIVYLKNRPLADMPPETKLFSYKVLPGSSLWILTRLMPDLFTGRPRPDVFFSPSHYAPPFAPMPRICSIMDLGYLEFMGQFKKYDYWQLRLWTAISINISKSVIAISNSTKKDIVRHYPFASGKTYVTHLGYDKERFNQQVSKEDVRRTLAKYSIVGDYILYLGTLKPSKNLEGLIEAYASISGVKLVIAGKKGWLYEPIFQKVKESGRSNDVIFTDYVPEADKPALIAGAKVFVLPSFWEGFGLDLLPAMACGVVVVVSKAGSLPEVVGDAGVLVDPNSVSSIASGIKRVLTMSKLEYNKQVDKGLKQAAKFSWEKTAQETLKIITNVYR